MSMGNFDKYKGLFAEGGGFDIPSHYGVGIAFDATPQLQVALDYERIRYSEVKSVGNPSASLLACAGGDASSCLGGSNGAGFGWRDIDAWKLGLQYRVDERLTLRAGYNVSDNPIRPQDVTINILAPGVVRHHVTGGASWALGRESALNFAAMYAFDNDVTAPSFFNNFAPGLAMQEKIKMHEYSVGRAVPGAFLGRADLFLRDVELVAQELEVVAQLLDADGDVLHVSGPARDLPVASVAVGILPRDGHGLDAAASVDLRELRANEGVEDALADGGFGHGLFFALK
jgi:Long-chain fatty acid transport protein